MFIQEISIKRLKKVAANAPKLLCLGLSVLLTGLVISGCANFKILGRNLDFMDESYILSVKIGNARGMKNLKGAVVEWNPRTSEVLSGDFAAVNNPVGTFGFFVRTSENQYVMAYSDSNGNDLYDEGEPAWMHSDASGRPAPVIFDAHERKARILGTLSKSAVIPRQLLADVKKFAAGRSRAEIISRLNIPIALGDIANLSDPRFTSERGEQGLWQPVDFPVDSGIGIYFLDEYDPNRIPVLFVYGAGGSPQDWRSFFDKIDRKKYQPWFYFYPTGRRLDEMGGALNRGVETLHDFYGFNRLHVVAHSMGGMVARSFITKNVLDDGNRYISKFVTISTPWGGHEAAAAGVKHAPEVVPSWRDMAAESDFQKELYARSLAGKVEHLLIYGNKGKKSMFLPPENDGTVSVASQRHGPVLRMSVYFKSFYSDHVGILSNPEVIELTQRFLGAK